MSITDEYLYDIVCKVAEVCNLKNWRHSAKNFERIGQNYFGIVIPVSLIDSDRVIPMVLKLAPTDERYRVSGAVTLFFRREIFVYSKLLQSYSLIQRNFPLISQFIIPKLYFTCEEYCKEAIVLEDMTYKGYNPYVDKTFLDLAHIVLAIKAIARLHGLSFILQTKDPALYDEVQKVCIPLTEATNKRFMEIMMDRLDKALVKFEVTNYVELFRHLKQNCGMLFNKAIDCTKRKCIGHGDIWKENILFKYEENKPISACVIDYQTTRLTSPAFDFLYLIITSTDTVLRKDNYNDLIHTYYNTLDETLKLGGLNTETVYSFDEFKFDLKAVAPSCLIVANTALWLSNGLQEVGHVRSKLQWTTEDDKNKAVNKYKSIVQAIIDDFYTYNYLPYQVD